MHHAPQTQTLAGLGAGRTLVRWLMHAVGNPDITVRLWDGDEFRVTDNKPVATLEFTHPRALYRLLASPSVGFGECYAEGLLEVHGDFLAFMNEVTRALTRKQAEAYRWPRLYSKLHALRQNTPLRATRNARHHYDLDNDFYRLWLDEQMVYTCAYFPTPDTTLEQAQIAKMDHVCRKLRLQAGERVIEAGCGWGALALHMARHYGTKVRAFNISKAQLEFARERADREGLASQVEFVEADYREISGTCDAFVSVGMLEHVGPDRYPELGGVMNRCLPASGRGLIHTIGTDRPGPMNTWIERNIFPGARPPSLGEMMPLFGPHGFSILDVENIRLHYARTLAHWLARFEAAENEVLSRFDATFVRAWRFYLAASQASFTTGNLQLFQVLFARSGYNEIPWTREYLYKV